MRKLIAKLVNWQAQRRNPKDFNQPQVIQGQKAKEHRLEAMEKNQERVKDEMKQREEPTNILGPSDSESV